MKKKKPRKQPPKGFTLHKVDVIFKGIPRDLRDAFKAYCARRGITMKRRMEELMQSDVNSEMKAIQNAAQFRRNTI